MSRVIVKHKCNCSVTEKKKYNYFTPWNNSEFICIASKFLVVANWFFFEVNTNFKKLLRKVFQMGNYSFSSLTLKIYHRPGSQHQNLVYLSRLPTIVLVSHKAFKLYSLLLKQGNLKLTLRLEIFIKTE